MYECEAQGCTRPRHALGMCRNHYRALIKYGSPFGKRQTNADRECSTEDCKEPVRCSGLCRLHYSRRLSGLPENYQRKKICTIEECQFFVHGGGLCNLHWQRQDAWGNPFGYNIECCRCAKVILVTRRRKYCAECKIEVRKFQKADAQAARHRAMCKPDYDRLSVFDDDGWVCYLCNTDVDRFCSDRLRSASIDHVIPVSRGGTNTRGNVRLAHLYCNIKKNDKELMS